MLQQGSTACNGYLKPDGSPPRKSDRIIEARPHEEQPELLYILFTLLSSVLISVLVLPFLTCCCSVAQLCTTLCNPMDYSTQVFPLLSTRVCSNSCPLSWWYHPTISSCHLLLFFLQSFLESGFFFNELALCIRWPNYWSFSISLSNEYPGLISFWIDWFDLLAVQGTLKGLLQHHNLKVSMLQCSAFFMVQLSHLYMTTGKDISLTI